jgi:hypothetical protein
MQTVLNMMKNSLPRYVTIQPSTGKKVTFRPFTVKEEKYLLMTKQTGEYADLLATIANIIDSCFELGQEAKKLPIFDIEYFFLKLRSKSIGEIVEPTIVCPYTDEKIKLSLNIDDIQPVVKHTNFNIRLNENIIVNMKYPTLDILLKNSDDDLYDVTLNCIESIETIDEKIENSDISKKEFLEFIDLMTNDQFKKIIEFIKNVPTLEKEISYITSDGVERKIRLKGIKDFFQ